MVADGIDEPRAYRKWEREGGENDHHLSEAVEKRTQHQENQEERCWNNQCKPVHRPLEIDKLPGPGDGIAGRQCYLLCDARLCVLYIAAEIAAADIHKDPPGELTVFAADHIGTLCYCDGRHVLEQDRKSTRLNSSH